MKAKHFFNPEEIIFSATDACNLHCPHCFVSRTPDKLDISAVKNFLASCKGTNINKIGFNNFTNTLLDVENKNFRTSSNFTFSFSN